MVKEHAVTVKGKLGHEQLNYIIKKANRLGWSHRTIDRVTTTKDEDGRHIYFEIEAVNEDT